MHEIKRKLAILTQGTKASQLNTSALSEANDQTPYMHKHEIRKAKKRDTNKEHNFQRCLELLHLSSILPSLLNGASSFTMASHYKHTLVLLQAFPTETKQHRQSSITGSPQSQGNQQHSNTLEECQEKLFSLIEPCLPTQSINQC